MTLPWDFFETKELIIRVPSVPLAVALLVPATGYILHRLTALPKPRTTWEVSSGLKDVPPGPERIRINAIYPEDALGTALYANLPFGKTKYSISGPQNGRKVVLIHGFSIPSIIYKDVHDRLVTAGFRVLTYDLYGRGYSEAPHDLSLPIYVTQLALLLQHISWAQTRVVGLSMGGAVAAAFASQFPNLVDGDVALLAAVGNFTDDFTLGRLGRLLTLPFFSWLTSLTVIKSWKSFPLPPRSHLQAIEQLPLIQWRALPRFGQVIASTVRTGPLRGVGPAYAVLGSSNFRILIVHGTADRSVPYHPYMSPILTNYMPKAKVVTLENVGHELTVTHPDDVADALITFFSDA